MAIEIRTSDRIERNEVLALYTANEWSSADKPDQLLAALSNSHFLVTAREQGGALVGLANSISDGHLVVFYPHLLVHPHRQKQGIGRKMMEVMQARYAGFHQQILVADAQAIGFYRALGFHPAGKTQAMWIYAGNEH